MLLTPEIVKAAGLKAYEEGRLSAQGPTPACQYRDDSGRPCVIGAAIPDDHPGLAEFNESVPVDGLTMWHIQLQDVPTLRRLQGLHDSWCMARVRGVSIYGGREDEQIPQPAEFWEQRLFEELKS